MRSSFVLLVALALSGCGFKGPLYLPKPDAKKPAVAVKPEPPPERPTPSQSTPPPQ